MKTALLVEDSVPTIRIATAVLDSAGYEVVCERGARKARERCLARAFDFYLVDVTLEGTERVGWASGIDFVKWLVHFHHVGAKVVLWSANDHTEEARELGVAFVRKGDLDALRRAIP